MIGFGSTELILISCILGFVVFMVIVILLVLLLRQRSTSATILPGMNYLKREDAAGGDVASGYPDSQMVGLRGQPISAVPPADGQVLVWNQAAGQGEPRHLLGITSGPD